MTWKTALALTIGTVGFVGVVSTWAASVGHPVPPILFVAMCAVGLVISLGGGLLLPPEDSN
jgi:hypothetical protein